MTIMYVPSDSSHSTRHDGSMRWSDLSHCFGTYMLRLDESLNLPDGVEHVPVDLLILGLLLDAPVEQIDLSLGEEDLLVGFDAILPCDGALASREADLLPLFLRRV
ncbi:MAG: hypothetical protein MZV49_24235 [Rhodopseudomonas palustris]|nr:hypothetical protein [Rhodopseudomonas palustris]